MKSTITVIAGLFAASIALNSVSAQKSVRLAFDLQKGEEYNLLQTSDQEIRQTVMGIEQNIEQHITLGYSLTVEDVSGKGYDMRNTYDRVSVDQKTPQGSSSYDSNEPNTEPDAMTKLFAAQVGKSFGYEMNKWGEVLSVSGTEEFIDGIIAYYEIPEGAQREEMKKTLADQFNDETMTKQIAQLVTTYPEKEVSVGDSWSHSSVLVRQGVSMNVETTYTVKEITSKQATLTVKSTIQTSDEPIMQGGMEMVYSLKGDQSGEIIIDLKTGMVVESQVSQKVSGMVDMLPSEQLPDGMSGSVTIETTITLTSQ